MRRVAWLLAKFSLLFLTGVYLSGFAMFMDKFKEVMPVDVLFPFEVWIVWILSLLFLGWCINTVIQIVLFAFGLRRNKGEDSTDIAKGLAKWFILYSLTDGFEDCKGVSLEILKVKRDK